MCSAIGAVSSIQKTIWRHTGEHKEFKKQIEEQARVHTEKHVDQVLEVDGANKNLFTAKSLEEAFYVSNTREGKRTTKRRVQNAIKLLEAQNRINRKVEGEEYTLDIDGFRKFYNDNGKSLSEFLPDSRGPRGFKWLQGYSDHVVGPAALFDNMDGYRSSGVWTKEFTDNTVKAEGWIKEARGIAGKKMEEVKIDNKLTGESMQKIGIISQVKDWLTNELFREKTKEKRLERLQEIREEAPLSVARTKKQGDYVEDLPPEFLPSLLRAVEKDIKNGVEDRDYHKDFLDEGELKYYEKERMVGDPLFDAAAEVALRVTGKNIKEVKDYFARELLTDDDQDIVEIEEGIPFLAKGGDGSDEYLSKKLGENSDKEKSLNGLKIDTPDNLKTRKGGIRAANIHFEDVSRRKHEKLINFIGSAEQAAKMYKILKTSYDSKTITPKTAAMAKRHTDMFAQGKLDISGKQNRWTRGLEGFAGLRAQILLSNPFGALSTQLLNFFEKSLKVVEYPDSIRGMKHMMLSLIHI